MLVYSAHWPATPSWLRVYGNTVGTGSSVRSSQAQVASPSATGVCRSTLSSYTVTLLSTAWSCSNTTGLANDCDLPSPQVTVTWFWPEYAGSDVKPQE